MATYLRSHMLVRAWVQNAVWFHCKLGWSFGSSLMKNLINCIFWFSLCILHQNNISQESQTMVLVDHPNVLKSHCSFLSDHNLWVIIQMVLRTLLLKQFCLRCWRAWAIFINMATIITMSKWVSNNYAIISCTTEENSIKVCCLLYLHHILEYMHDLQRVSKMHNLHHILEYMHNLHDILEYMHSLQSIPFLKVSSNEGA